MRISSIFLVWLFPQMLHAATAEDGSTCRGFVKLATGRAVFVDARSEDYGNPTLVLLNGLTYETGLAVASEGARP